MSDKIKELLDKLRRETLGPSKEEVEQHIKEMREKSGEDVTSMYKFGVKVFKDIIEKAKISGPLTEREEVLIGTAANMVVHYVISVIAGVMLEHFKEEEGEKKA